MGDTSGDPGSLDSNVPVDQSSLDAYAAYDSSGTVAYNPDTTVQSTAGGVVNSSNNPLVAPPDASGGNGSFLTPLQNAMTQGLNDTLVSATEFGFASLTDRIAVATGVARPVPAGAPVPVRSGFGGLSPGLLIIGGAILLLVVLAK